MRKFKRYSLILSIGLIILYVLRNKSLEKHYGTNYNEEREKIGLIKIDKEWDKDPDWGAKTTYWRIPNPKSGHFKKVLEFNLLKIKAEIDYYKQKDNTEFYAFSKFDYKDNSTTYFVIRSNSFVDGKWYSEYIKQIGKTDFMDFINKSKTTANKK